MTIVSTPGRLPARDHTTRRGRRRGGEQVAARPPAPSYAVPYAAVVGRVTDLLLAGTPPRDAAAARIAAERIVDDVLAFAVRWLDP